MIGIVWYIQKEQDKKRHPIFINRFIFSKTITYNLLHQRYKLPSAISEKNPLDFEKYKSKIKP